MISEIGDLATSSPTLLFMHVSVAVLNFISVVLRNEVSASVLGEKDGETENHFACISSWQIGVSYLTENAVDRGIILPKLFHLYRCSKKVILRS